MPLLFLHGPPATGKLTVARELAALTGWELFHNHLVVDAVLRDHPFGTPGFDNYHLAVTHRDHHCLVARCVSFKRHKGDFDIR